MFAAERPFALMVRAGSPDVLYVAGPVITYDKLADIPRKQGAEGHEVYDTLSIVPFRQVEELGFACNHDNEKILTLLIEEQKNLPLDQTIALLPDAPCALDGAVAATPDDDAFTALTQRIIDTEIGNGEGCNFVVPRFFRGKIASFSHEVALSAYKRLLQKEYGTYWTFLYYTGEQYFIGATPERHLSVHKGRVKMNPISGTFRKMEHEERAAMPALEAFLKDPKETFELLMVVDEELKMMAEICSTGGQVVGPMLKEMAKLVHTEYVLVGQSNKDIADMLRESMFAATVVGSPVENACRVNARHQKESRRYYGSALALLGRADDGSDTLDSPITIRTVEIAKDGSFAMGVGTTIVRDSDARAETAETSAKVAGTLAAFGFRAGSNAPTYRLGAQVYSEEPMITLSARNARLSRFWIEDQSETRVPDPRLAGRSVTLIDNEDNFTRMLAHMIRALGMTAKIVRNEAFDPLRDDADVIVLGPGPGDPRDGSVPRIAKANALCRAYLEKKKPMLCVCLGHQVLCNALGFPLAKKQRPFQGAQEVISLFGQNETVGFYNTFTGKVDGKPRDVEISFDEPTGEINALRGSPFIGLQFHPESLLTSNGLRIVQDVMLHLVANL